MAEEEKNKTEEPEHNDELAESPEQNNHEGAKLRQETGEIDINEAEKNIDTDDDKIKSTSSGKLNENQKIEIKDILKDELRDGVQEVKKDFLIIFGIFASFVTFISIIVQIFRNNDNVYELLGISSITLSFILLFALLINMIVKGKEKWADFAKPTHLVVIIFVFVGIGLLWMGGISSNNKKNQDVGITDSIVNETMIKYINKFSNQMQIDTILIEALKADITNIKDREINANFSINDIKNKITIMQETQKKQWTSLKNVEEILSNLKQKNHN